MTVSTSPFPLPLLQRLRLALLPDMCLPTPGLRADLRPAHWAPRILPEPLGLPNLHLVAPGFYRAAQPEAEGFRAAEALGIRTVISLRQTVRDTSRARGTGLTLIRIPIKSRHVGEGDGARIVLAMRSLRHGLGQGPVLVHCHHGADRTGLIAALWRILYEGWSRQEAIDEMIEGGFGFHPIWANIPRYLSRFDIADLRARIEA